MERVECGFRVRVAQIRQRNSRRRFDILDKPVDEPLEVVAVECASSCGQSRTYGGAGRFGSPTLRAIWKLRNAEARRPAPKFGT